MNGAISSHHSINSLIHRNGFFCCFVFHFIKIEINKKNLRERLVYKTCERFFSDFSFKTGKKFLKETGKNTWVHWFFFLLNNTAVLMIINWISSNSLQICNQIMWKFWIFSQLTRKFQTFSHIRIQFHICKLVIRLNVEKGILIDFDLKFSLKSFFSKETHHIFALLAWRKFC